MGVYNDMASDAGYGYGTLENRQIAEMLEYQEMQQSYGEQRRIEEELREYHDKENKRREILFRKFSL